MTSDLENTIDHYPFVDLIVAPRDRMYGIIHVRSETRHLFPGYRHQFILETDVKPFVMHLTAANYGTMDGAEQGGYLCHPRPTAVEWRFLRSCPDAHTNSGSFKRFYEAHREIQARDIIRIGRVSEEQYRILRVFSQMAQLE